MLKSTKNGIFCILMLLVVGIAGCSTDFRKGSGAGLVYKTEIRLLEGPLSNQVTVGNDSAKVLASHNPPDFSNYKKEEKIFHQEIISDNRRISKLSRDESQRVRQVRLRE